LVHNRECPKCGSIGVWNWAEEKKELTMPSGEKVLAKVTVEGEPQIKCEKCGHKFDPRVNELLDKKFAQLERGLKKGGII